MSAGKPEYQCWMPLENDCPMVYRMAGDHIFNIYTDDLSFKIEENCDSYYSSVLSPSELRQLGEELILISNRAKP